MSPRKPTYHFTPEQLQAAVRDHDGNVSAAARSLGVSRPHLIRLLEGAGLSKLVTRLRVATLQRELDGTEYADSG